METLLLQMVINHAKIASKASSSLRVALLSFMEMVINQMWATQRQERAWYYGWLSSSFVAPKPFPEQISPFHAACLPWRRHSPLPSGAQ